MVESLKLVAIEALESTRPSRFALQAAMKRSVPEIRSTHAGVGFLKIRFLVRRERRGMRLIGLLPYNVLYRVKSTESRGVGRGPWD